MAERAGKQRKEVVNADYLKPHDGYFRKWVKEATQYSKTRELKGGKIINEELFEAVTGRIKQIYVFDNVFETKDGKVEQPTLVIRICYKDDKRKEVNDVIQTPFEYGFAQSFLMYLPNIDLSKMVTLKAFTIKDDEKSKTKGSDVYNDYMIPYQGVDAEGKDIKVEKYYVYDAKTKTTSNGLPEITIKRDKAGKVKSVDKVERLDFFKDLISQTNEKVSELIKDFLTEEKPEAFASTSADDDLPF